MELFGAPLEMDRELSRAFAAWQGFRRRLVADPRLDDAPLELHRAVSSRSAFLQLAELPEADPLREPLRRWVYRLLEQRVNHAAIVEEERARRVERHAVASPVPGELSLSELLERALSDPARRVPWLQSFLDRSASCSGRVVALWQRRGEVARRLGLASPAAIEGSVDDAPELARAIAERLRERVLDLGLRTPSAWVERALGEDVRAAWPHRISGPRLFDYFRDGDLLRGLDLPSRRLPRALGAASFLRGFGALGSAWHEAQVPRDQPFCIARDPYRLEEHAASSLLAALPSNPAFLQRRLEVGRDALADVRRRLAQIHALELSIAALRVQLRAAASTSEARFREQYQERCEVDLGLVLPPQAAGVLFRLGVEDEQRLLGRLLAARREQRLIEEHDEDWFRNPRAIEQLRAEARLPPRTRLERAEAEAAVRAALASIEAAWPA